jgi:hypothetical protein
MPLGVSSKEEPMDYQKEIAHAAVDAGRTWCSATNRMWCKAARCFGAGHVAIPTATTTAQAA